MKTLLIIDVQNDFLEGGQLEVPRSNRIIPVINQIQESYDLIVATQDWHPEDHKSFASNHTGKKPFDKIMLHGMPQTLWPDHCIQGSKGAALHQGLNTGRIAAIFRKGMDPEVDSYSAFHDNNHQLATGLAGYLKEKGAVDIHFCGLAADICVYYSILDSILEGFTAFLVEDASSPLDNRHFDDVKCELVKLGVKIVTSSQITS